MKKWVLRRPEMMSSLTDPSFGAGVWLQLLIALTIYMAFNKASVVAAVGWVLWLVLGKGFTSAQEMLDVMNASQGLMLFSLFFTAVLIVFTIIYLRRIEKRLLATAGISRRLAVPRYLAGFIAGAAALVLCNALPLIGSGVTYKGFTVFVPIYFVAFVIQSASEELLFRGMLVPGISRRTGLLPAVLISSALFSVAHALNGGYTLLGGVYYLLIGSFLALLMLRTNSLWASCGFHSAWNFTIGLLGPISISGITSDYAIFSTSAMTEEETVTNAGILGDPYYLVLIGIFLVLIALLLFVGRNRLVVRAPLPPEGAEQTPQTPSGQPVPPPMPYYPYPSYYPPTQVPPTGQYYPPTQMPSGTQYYPPTQTPPYPPYYPPVPGNMNYPPAPGAPYYPPAPGVPYYPPTQMPMSAGQNKPPMQPSRASRQPLEETPRSPQEEDDE